MGTVPFFPPLTEGALQGVLRATDPAARLVWPRVLRRVIRRHTRLPGFGLRVPHRKSYVLAREPLLEIADRQELGFLPDEELPPQVILLERLATDELAGAAADAILLHYWRLLLHARTHLALEERIAAGKLPAGDVRRRIQQIGTVAFDEIRSVLSQERFLLPPCDETAVYVEFAAVYLELRLLAPALVPVYFPAIESPDAINRVLAQDLDAQGLLLATRPAGAPDLAGDWSIFRPIDQVCTDDAIRKHGPVPFAAAQGGGKGDRSMFSAHVAPAGQVVQPKNGPGYPLGTAQPASYPADDYEPGDEEGVPAAAAQDLGQPFVYPYPSQAKYERWARRAERAAAQGNLAGAAIRRARAAAWAPGRRPALAALRYDLSRLVARLLAALDAGDQDSQLWRDALLALAYQTPRGLWTVEARLLYDLQKVCVDHERGIYTTDLVEWVLSLGRRPLKRPLPSQREVLMAKHLQRALGRLVAARLPEHYRRQLWELLHAATARTEQRLRDQFRPQIAATLDEVGLRTENLAERVARKKLIEELLDRIAGRGFLRLGDFRDALSRNNLKLPDCAGAGTFFRGDALLEADSRLARVLDGVYERGEFYLRWMHRLSMLAFGTRPGRFLTRYLAIPFGGAFLVVAFVEELQQLLTGRLSLLYRSFRHSLPLGIFFLALKHVGWFRRGVWRVAKTAGRVLSFLFIDCIRWLVDLPLVAQILNSRLTLFLFRFLVKPLVPTLLLGVFVPVWPESAAGWGLLAAFFALLSLAINSRLGRDLEEMAADAVVEGWHRIGLRILTGLFWLVMDLSRRLLQGIERLLYTVDEWLRFKNGQSTAALWAKAGIGVVWFFISYLVRFCVTLLLEPQINPIKHFPVVTVSHKVIYGLFFLSLRNLLELRMNHALADVVAAAILACIPGIFGFLVWECRENWRLYAANRPKGLRPVLVGAHGESMPRLLRPGLHSGTLPKRFAKLRRAPPPGRESRPPPPLALLGRGVGGAGRPQTPRSPAAHRVAGAAVSGAGVRRALARVRRLALAAAGHRRNPPGHQPRADRRPLSDAVRSPAFRRNAASRRDYERARITFETTGGWVLADAEGHESLADISPAAQRVLQTALLGLDKTAGADLVLGQIRATLGRLATTYDLDAQGLRVWSDDFPDDPIHYDLHTEGLLVACTADGRPSGRLPTLRRPQLVFAEVEVPWDEWVAAWEGQWPSFLDGLAILD